MWIGTELAIDSFNYCVDIVELFVWSKNPWRLRIIILRSSLLQLGLACFRYLSWEILLEILLLLVFSLLILLCMRTRLLFFPSRMRFILIRWFRWRRVTWRVRMKEHGIRCESDNRLRLVDVILDHFVHENVSSMCSCCGNLWMLLRMYNCRNVEFCIVRWFQLVFAVHRFSSLLQQFSSAILRNHLLRLFNQWRCNRRLIFNLTNCYLIILTIFTLLFMMIPYEIISNILSYISFIISLSFSSLTLLLHLHSLNITNILFFSDRAP